MSGSASYLGCFLLALVFAGGAETRAADFDARVTAAIDNWAQDTHIVVTKPVKAALLMDAHAAVDEAARKHQEFRREDIEQVVPAAVVTLLKDTQGNQSAATLPQLLQERITGNGLVFPQISDYPTLSVTVTPSAPPDFVVSIDGVDYTAGSVAFRLKAGVVTVSVRRSGHSPCQQRLNVTRVGPNVVTCRL